jgi:hypothetical protein
LQWADLFCAWSTAVFVQPKLWLSPSIATETQNWPVAAIMVYVSCPLIWRPAFCNMYLFIWQRFLVSQLIKVTWLYYLSLYADRFFFDNGISCHVTLHLGITVGGNQAITQHTRLLLPFFCTVRFFTGEVSLQGWNWESMYG